MSNYTIITINIVLSLSGVRSFKRDWEWYFHSMLRRVSLDYTDFHFPFVTYLFFFIDITERYKKSPYTERSSTL